MSQIQGAAAEREAIVAFLRRTATDYRQMASRALADADLWTAASKHLDEAANVIAIGGHWR